MEIPASTFHFSQPHSASFEVILPAIRLLQPAPISGLISPRSDLNETASAGSSSAGIQCGRGSSPSGRSYESHVTDEKPTAHETQDSQVTLDVQGVVLVTGTPALPGLDARDSAKQSLRAGNDQLVDAVSPPSHTCSQKTPVKLAGSAHFTQAGSSMKQSTAAMSMDLQASPSNVLPGATGMDTTTTCAGSQEDVAIVTDSGFADSTDASSISGHAERMLRAEVDVEKRVNASGPGASVMCGDESSQMTQGATSATSVTGKSMVELSGAADATYKSSSRTMGTKDVPGVHYSAGAVKGESGHIARSTHHRSDVLEAPVDGERADLVASTTACVTSESQAKASKDEGLLPMKSHMELLDRYATYAADLQLYHEHQLESIIDALRLSGGIADRVEEIGVNAMLQQCMAALRQSQQQRTTTVHLEGCLAESSNIVNELRHQVVSLSSQLSSSRQSYASLANEKNILTRRISELEKQCADYKQSLQDRKEDNNEDMSAAMKALTETVRQKEEELERNRVSQVELHKMKLGLSQALEQSRLDQRVLGRVLPQYETLCSELEASKAQVAAAKETAADTSSDLSHCQVALKAANVENEKLKRHISGLETEVHSLLLWKNKKQNETSHLLFGPDAVPDPVSSLDEQPAGMGVSSSPLSYGAPQGRRSHAPTYSANDTPPSAAATITNSQSGKSALHSSSSSRAQQTVAGVRASRDGRDTIAMHLTWHVAGATEEVSSLASTASPVRNSLQRQSFVQRDSSGTEFQTGFPSGINPPHHQSRLVTHEQTHRAPPADLESGGDTSMSGGKASIQRRRWQKPQFTAVLLNGHGRGGYHEADQPPTVASLLYPATSPAAVSSPQILERNISSNQTASASSNPFQPSTTLPRSPVAATPDSSQRVARRLDFTLPPDPAQATLVAHGVLPHIAIGQSSADSDSSADGSSPPVRHVSPGRPSTSGRLDELTWGDPVHSASLARVSAVTNSPLLTANHRVADEASPDKLRQRHFGGDGSPFTERRPPKPRSIEKPSPVIAALSGNPLGQYSEHSAPTAGPGIGLPRSGIHHVMSPLAQDSLSHEALSSPETSPRSSAPSGTTMTSHKLKPGDAESSLRQTLSAVHAGAIVNGRSAEVAHAARRSVDKTGKIATRKKGNQATIGTSRKSSIVQQQALERVAKQQQAQVVQAQSQLDALLQEKTMVEMELCKARPRTKASIADRSRQESRLEEIDAHLHSVRLVLKGLSYGSATR